MTYNLRTFTGSYGNNQEGGKTCNKTRWHGPWFMPNSVAMNFGRRQHELRCTYAIGVPPRPWKVRRPTKHEARGCCTSPICAYLVAWVMQNCRIKGEPDWTPNASNVCYLDFVKAQRHIGSLAWRWRLSSTVQTWCISKSKRIWRIVQVGALTTYRRWRWKYPPNRMRRTRRHVILVVHLYTRHLIFSKHVSQSCIKFFRTRSHWYHG